MNQGSDPSEPGVECNYFNDFPLDFFCWQISFVVDAITALEYNINGDFLATGDRSGRITVLKIDEDDRKKAEVYILVHILHYYFQ